MLKFTVSRISGKTPKPTESAVIPGWRLSGTAVTVLALMSVLTACSHMGLQRAGDNSALATPQEQTIINESQAPVNDLTDSGSDLNAIPIEVNKMVLRWVDYFQGRGRPHMERYLSRSTRYMPVMKEILKKEGLPEDLIYIALIESGFSSTAHSSANAVGYWQFIRGTGKRYGLEINSYVDERRDFIKSTQAAAAYFKGLYSLFGAWYLAIASYNVGEGRVKNLVMRNQTRDFWQLARENKLPDETINYVPKFLAARLIAKEPEKYGFTDIPYMPPLEFAEIELNHSVDIRKLAQDMSIEYDDLRDLNPAYKRGVALEKSGKLTLRVPKGMESAALAAASSAVAKSRKMYVTDEDYTYYMVRRGDTVSTLARKFRTSQRTIIQLNKLGRNARLIAGKRIRVPAESFERVSHRKKRGSSASRAIAQQGRRIHIVRKGDTLSEIARKYNVSLRELTAHNQIQRRALIPIGAKLEIP